MEYWSIEKDIKPLAITPTLQYSNTPKLVEIESSPYGLASFMVLFRFLSSKLFSRFRRAFS